RTLVIDPPWEYDWLSIAGRAVPGYATMSHEELLALDVGQWAEGDCHLYLCTTNNFSGRAHELMARWGFAYKTTLTWHKPEWGLGSYFRNQTEHVLFGIRGEIGTRPAAQSISTIFEGPIGEHSEKPEEFYQIVRTASYPPYGEGFQREPRPDFISLYEPSDKAPPAEPPPGEAWHDMWARPFDYPDLPKCLDRGSAPGRERKSAEGNAS